MTNRTVVAWLVALVLSAATLTTSEAVAQSSGDDPINSVGFHLGVNLEVDDFMLGAEGRFRLLELGKYASWNINPAFSLYLDSPLDFSLDVTTPFDFHFHHVVVPYAAPGLGLKNAFNNTELAFDILLGCNFVIPDTFVVPFVQFRIYVGDFDGAEFMAGIHFDLF